MFIGKGIALVGSVLTVWVALVTTAIAQAEMRSLPGSEKQYTDTQINNFFNAPDWYPGKHPDMPDVVQHGSKPKVFACASCHLASGGGHPESGSLAGLPAEYIFSQMKAYQRFERPALTGVMITIAKGMTDEQIGKAANYFASLPALDVQVVIEVEDVPRTYVNSRFMRLVSKGEAAGRESIGERIITVPIDEARVKARDPYGQFYTYVPKHYLEAGKKIVTQGNAGTAPCTSCHGADLMGTAIAPMIAGQHASYLFAQLRAYKEGVRRGDADPGGLMAENVKYFQDRELLAVAAYLASLPRQK